MNLTKRINNYYLKKVMKGEKVFYQIYDDNILISDSYSITLLKREEFFIDVNYFKELDLKHFIDGLNLDQYFEVVYFTRDDKYFILESLKGIKELIDRNYMKLFEGLSVKIISDIQPILFYDKEELKGFVLPIKEY